MTLNRDKREEIKHYLKGISQPNIHGFEYINNIKCLAQLCWDGSLQNGRQDLSFLKPFFTEVGRVITTGVPINHGYEKQENREIFIDYVRNRREEMTKVILVPDGDYRWGRHYPTPDEVSNQLNGLKKNGRYSRKARMRLKSIILAS